MRKIMLLLVMAVLLGGCSNWEEKEINYAESGAAKDTEENQILEIYIPLDGDTADESASDAADFNQATILIGGDILLSQYVLNAYDQAGGIDGVLDEHYRSAIERADLFLANQEFPFSNRGTAAPDKEFTFRLPPERVSIFQEMGLDIVSLANNHALDYGREALTDTIETLDGAGISHLGAGENLDEAKAPVIRDINGIRIGFIGATRVIPAADWAATNLGSGMLATYDPAVLLEEIRSLRQHCDYLIVYVHWGIERAEKPQEYQRELGQLYLDAGADLVVGSHPHVLQGIEYYHDKPVVYSLGNFIFGSSIPKTTLLQVDIRKDEDEFVSAISLIPGTSAAGYTRALTDEQALNQFYQYLESISFGAVFDGAGAVRTAAAAE